ncbi:MAG TPA: hypothetical protein VMB91_13545 [Solirubrobacteraceae bacterium]|nr:hypothetical protein [Solirubrobacteraceae bacterium]
MPCTIWITTGGDAPHAVHVEQTADEVAAEIRQASGHPIVLSETNSGVTVHVMPAAVAYFRDQGAIR